jgi:hypothetical protein
MDEDQGEAIMRRLELDNIPKKPQSDRRLAFDHAVDGYMNNNPFEPGNPEYPLGGI